MAGARYHRLFAVGKLPTFAAPAQAIYSIDHSHGSHIMPQLSLFGVRNLTALAVLAAAGNCLAATDLQAVVDANVKPLMQQQAIPGLAVAVVQDGKVQYFNYGTASKEAKQPVSENTLFEVGSVSKTFTATLGGYAQATGKLSVTDKASQVLPALRGSAFDNVSVLQLGTYTAGGLPLQFPDAFDHADKMLGYFKQWKPVYAAGTHRQYSNPSIGLFG